MHTGSFLEAVPIAMLQGLLISQLLGFFDTEWLIAAYILLHPQAHEPIRHEL